MYKNLAAMFVAACCIPPAFLQRQALASAPSTIGETGTATRAA